MFYGNHDIEESLNQGFEQIQTMDLEIWDENYLEHLRHKS